MKYKFGQLKTIAERRRLCRLGCKGEAEIIAKWEKQFGISIFTPKTNQMTAMKALGVKKFAGLGYDFNDTSIVARYFTDTGFNVLELEKLPGPWEEVGRLSSKDIYASFPNASLGNPGGFETRPPIEPFAGDTFGINSRHHVPLLVTLLRAVHYS